MGQNKEKRKIRQDRWLAKNPEYYSNYYLEHKDAKSAYAKRYNRELKLEVLSHYGTKCTFCSEPDLDKLSIDHINGGGLAHRRSLGMAGSGTRFYLWLRRNNYPSGYRVLCLSCNNKQPKKRKES